MSSPSNNIKWMSYLEENLLEVEQPQSFDSFQWCSIPSVPEQGSEQGDCRSENDGSKVDSDDCEKVCSRKRAREDSCGNQGGAGTKACREKARRDRLNDRFMELSSALDPGRPPKQDKGTILCDAVRVLGQLRTEADKLRDSNHQLRESIKDLKAEKNDLRDEKVRLKADKERLEQQLKAITIPPGYLPHPTAFHAAAAAFAAQTMQAQAASKVHQQAEGYPGMAMWQWMPPATVDTSQDHVLRPPVA